MICARVRSELAKAERASFGQLYQSDVSLEPKERDLKRLANIQRLFLVATFDKDVDIYHVHEQNHERRYMQKQILPATTTFLARTSFEPAVDVNKNDCVQQRKPFRGKR